MKRFRSIIMAMQGHSKNELCWLYNTKLCENRDNEDDEKRFLFDTMPFWFGGTSVRNAEKLLLFIEVPAPFTEELCEEDAVAAETYMLKWIAPVINDLSAGYFNREKNIHDKAQFSMQTSDEVMVRRNGIHYNGSRHSFLLTVHFQAPLVHALTVNAKATFRAVKDILETVKRAADSLEDTELHTYISCHRKQMKIREYLHKNDLCVFIANGSVLPRENGTAKPMKNAIPFSSPKELEVTIPFENGKQIVGMGIRRGVTVITGGGYSGKSTLLDAMESGIYNHIPADGREYVITDDSAMKICAEDGRPIHNLDLSPFFKYLPRSMDPTAFSTAHASGSVSQAANILEAICGGSSLLLIDEDRSATNFMIRDQNMRKIVKSEPIIPFTDRIRELHAEQHVSSILVIGGSGEYLSCADCVILMDEYIAKDVTDVIQGMELPVNFPESTAAHWTHSRKIVPKQTARPFLSIGLVKTENEKRILLDDNCVDVSLLTGIETGDQLNTLALVMERLLTDKEAGDSELITKVRAIIEELFRSDGFEAKSLLPQMAWQWYKEIRPLDAFCCANRIRAVSFAKGDVLFT